MSPIEKQMYQEIIDILEKNEIELEDGLTDTEINEIEAFYKIKFPKILREFYKVALPITKPFINWRSFEPENVEEVNQALGWPLEGMLYDVEYCFWLEEWGPRPEDIEKAKQVCIEKMKEVPQLIPIYSHRYMPVLEGRDDAPVISVYQTDIIYYGENLKHYIQTEFGEVEHKGSGFCRKELNIPFWTKIINPYRRYYEE